jgi:hypothetical protein
VGQVSVDLAVVAGHLAHTAGHLAQDAGVEVVGLEVSQPFSPFALQRKWAISRISRKG